MITQTDTHTRKVTYVTTATTFHRPSFMQYVYFDSIDCFLTIR